jgi:hypothetical protein
LPAAMDHLTRALALDYGQPGAFDPAYVRYQSQASTAIGPAEASPVNEPNPGPGGADLRMLSNTRPLDRFIVPLLADVKARLSMDGAGAGADTASSGVAGSATSANSDLCAVAAAAIAQARACADRSPALAAALLERAVAALEVGETGTLIKHSATSEASDRDRDPSTAWRRIPTAFYCSFLEVTSAPAANSSVAPPDIAPSGPQSPLKRNASAKVESKQVAMTVTLPAHTSSSAASPSLRLPAGEDGGALTRQKHALLAEVTAV